MTQTDLAGLTGKSVSYVNRTMTGTRTVSPGWADTVARALELSGPATKELHVAAAIDSGYRLDRPVKRAPK